MNIDKYKLTLRGFTVELDGPVDREKRSYLLVEVDVHDVRYPTNDDGTYDEVAVAKWVGGFEIKQGDKKAPPIKGKSRRTHSQKLRQAIWKINPSEEYYQSIMDKIIYNIEDIIANVEQYEN